MKIWDEQYVKILAVSNRPYHFFKTYVSMDGGVFHMSSVRFESRLRSVTEGTRLRIYPKSRDEARFLTKWFRKRDLGRVDLEFMGYYYEEEEKCRSMVHDVLSHPLAYQMELTVDLGKEEKLIESFRELRKIGYRTAYFISGDRFIIR